MELHYNINATMDGMAGEFFLPSIPQCLVPVGHRCEVATSGEFAKDGFYDLIAEKVDWILSVIEARLDGEVMLWTDVDIIFNSWLEGVNIAEEIEEMMVGRDLMLQREVPHGEMCNTGFLAIRRNTRSLVFFAQVRIMLELFHPSEQDCANHLLGLIDGLEWGLFPLSYASESNGGFGPQSRIYHANCTVVDSLNSKEQMLAGKREFWRDGG